MKAPAFSYLRPENISQAIDFIDIYGDEARWLAGGQSLLAALNMRLAAPSVLIDINGLSELAGISVNAGKLIIGALTRHREIEHSPLVAQHASLLALAMPHVAHAAVRNRGTFGGSIAFADPAAELPACCIALDAEFVIVGRGGERRVRARHFFTGLYETALQTGEILVAAEIPCARDKGRAAFRELARRHGDYAIAGLAVQAAVEGDVLRDVNIAFFGVDSKPVLAEHAASVLEQGAATPARIEQAQHQLAQDLAPQDDVHYSGAMRMQLARVLLARAIGDLVNLETKSAAR
ncbi:MAG: xanthine dehydrogenase family protein subunit M [Betaproteobacteria bacterium]|nr:xanthine dehydrogenase family protein subunit M [Betaproteobacteria bacterium]MDH5341514.1 xanthine dehydrogenase family protein subunit M [Betaproteobacteria bacterium]